MRNIVIEKSDYLPTEEREVEKIIVAGRAIFFILSGRRDSNSG